MRAILFGNVVATLFAIVAPPASRARAAQARGDVIVVRFAGDGSERKLMAEYAPVSRR